MTQPQTYTPKFATLIEIYENVTAKFAKRPLFGTKTGGQWNWITYEEFGQKTNLLRSGLAQLGISPGDRVAVISNNRPEWAMGAFATYGRGGAYVPMYEAQQSSEWKDILADCGAKMVFVANDKIRDLVLDMKSSLPSLQHVVVFQGTAKGDAITFQQLMERGAENIVPVHRPTADTICSFIYTSGTTGKPKGVKLSHHNLACNVQASLDQFPITSEDRTLSFLPWAHVFGLTAECLGIFSLGGSMAIAESVDKILDNLSEVQPTLLFSVPRIFNRIYESVNKQMRTSGFLKKKLIGAALANAQERRKLSEQHRTNGRVEFLNNVYDKIVFQKVRDRFGGRLKYAVSGGAALSREVAEFIDNLGITVYEGYGLTETSPVVSFNWPGARKIGSVGKPIPGVAVKIDLEASGDPKHGEIVVYGHDVMVGYHDRPEEDAQVFTKDGGFRTGDLGYVDDEGYLYITGRIKEQYKLENGKYVAPAPLEEGLKLSGYINNAFIFGDNKPYNVALIVPNLPEVEEWAKSNGIDASGQALLANPRVQSLFKDEIDRVSSEFKQFEKIKKFKLIGEDFTTENGMLTPKMSLKRRVVIVKYEEALTALYK